MNIAIVGTGYVGLVSGVCFAEMGVHVVCVDRDRNRIEQLRAGSVPLYEPGISEMVARNVEQGRLSFETEMERVLSGVDILFIAVGTPPLPGGGADLSSVEEVVRTVGRQLEGELLIVVKSTVPPGTSHKLRQIMEEEQAAAGLSGSFDLASNPEFLKEGAAIRDFMSPDRIIVGADSPRAVQLLQRLYAPFMLKKDRLLVMDTVSAEMSKYVSNAMLAARISIMNEVARLCEASGADIRRVREGVGSDQRIGNNFLYAGCGYGGSCFPKDIRALASLAREHGMSLEILETVEKVNQEQKRLLVQKVENSLDELPIRETPVVALWGLAFKPETDDIREAPAMTLIEELLEKGVRLQVYDPEAVEAVRKRFGNSLSYAENMYEAAKGADVLVLVTEWKEFRLPAWDRVRKNMRNLCVVDGRNLYNRSDMEAEGFSYEGIGC